MSETQQTGEPTLVAASDGRLTLSVPIRIKRRSGRKLVTLPTGEALPARPWDTAPTPLQLALARGYRWLVMLASGEVESLREIATREGVDNSYVSRMVNLTTLAPDIVAAILDDALPNHITLFDLAVDPPLLWEEQSRRLAEAATVTVPGPRRRMRSPEHPGSMAVADDSVIAYERGGRGYPSIRRWRIVPHRRLPLPEPAHECAPRCSVRRSDISLSFMIKGLTVPKSASGMATMRKIVLRDNRLRP